MYVGAKCFPVRRNIQRNLLVRKIACQVDGALKTEMHNNRLTLYICQVIIILEQIVPNLGPSWIEFKALAIQDFLRIFQDMNISQFSWLRDTLFMRFFFKYSVLFDLDIPLRRWDIDRSLNSCLVVQNALQDHAHRRIWCSEISSHSLL